MSKLLLDEKPLVILPSLAKEIGLNEAIILQQLHYWLQESNNERDGHKWVYNTYQDWQKQFPFWSKNTIIRAIKSLEKKGLIVTGNYNKMKIDNTKWYRINYEKLEGMGRPCTQNEQTVYSKWVDLEPKMSKPITREYTENTTDIKDDDKREAVSDLSEETTEKEHETKCNPATEFEKAFGYLPPHILQQEFEQIIESGQFQEPEAIICEVIKRARENAPRNPAKYISSILKNLEYMGLFTLKAVREYNELRDQKTKRVGKLRKTANEVDWEAL